MMDCNRKLHCNALPARIICCQIAGSQIPIAIHGAQQPRSASSSSSPDVETAQPRNPLARAPARPHTNGWKIELDENRAQHWMLN
jgi:hypothetical protein